MEVRGYRARETAQIVETLPDGESAAEYHSVGIDYLEAVCSLSVADVEYVPDIEVPVQDAGAMQSEQEAGQRIENGANFGTLGIEFGDGLQGLELRAERDEIAFAQQTMVPDINRCDLLGSVDPELSQPDCMAIGPYGLAWAQHTVYETVEERKMAVSFNDKVPVVEAKAFERIATVVQGFSVPVEKVGRFEGLD